MNKADKSTKFLNKHREMTQLQAMKRIQNANVGEIFHHAAVEYQLHI